MLLRGCGEHAIDRIHVYSAVLLPDMVSGGPHFPGLEAIHCLGVKGQVYHMIVPLRYFVPVLCIVVMCVSALALPEAAGQCTPERLSWMLDEERCGDLVFPDVIEIMHTCDDADLRARAAEGLGRYRGPEVFSALYRVLERDRSPLVRAAALNALDSIIQRGELKPGREIMEACFLVYQFDRYRPNRDRARELLKRFAASPKIRAERAYVSARYQPLEEMQVHAAADPKSARVAMLQPADWFTIVDEFYANDQTTCWFNIETPSGIRGWVYGLRDGRERIGTQDIPAAPFVSSVGSLAEIINPDTSVALELRTSRPKALFRTGEEIVFFVKAGQDCFITLIYFNPRSGGYILFPNRDQPVGRVSAGAEIRIPAEGSSLAFRASAPGVEEISVIATRNPVEIFASYELEPGAISAIKAGRTETARGIDRLLRYFEADTWAIAHMSITISE